MHAHANSATSTPRQQFESFIGNPAFPCVGARSALNRDRLRFGHYGALDSDEAARALRSALIAFAAEFPEPGQQPVSFVAIFDDEIRGGEVEFERRLWQQLRRLRDIDVEQGIGWDPAVDPDPADDEFSMSIGGRAFFVVGMFPGSSRLSRRSPLPCLVFNFHQQFVALKESGKYQSMQKAIRSRDIALQGSINPVLARFGEASEARQYSGRAVPADWVCPFAHGARRSRHV